MVEIHLKNPPEGNWLYFLNLLIKQVSFLTENKFSLAFIWLTSDKLLVDQDVVEYSKSKKCVFVQN